MMKPLAGLLALLMLVACGGEDENVNQKVGGLPDFDASWNYGAPEETRKVFAGILSEAGPDAPLNWKLELQTQIARTHSLVREFDEAHALLDTIEKGLTDETGRARLRYLLERGRAFNSSGKKSEAKPLFVEAWDVGREIGDDSLAVDAAHMVAIAVPGTEVAKQWNLKGLELARTSDDEGAQNWVGPLTYNMGWEAFDTGKPQEALDLFEESRQHFEGRGLEARERVSRWSVARATRELGRNEEALAMQLDLLAENETAETPDGFVFEELGELYLLKEEPELARENFAKALPMLEKELWLVDNEPDRITRLRELAGTSDTAMEN